MIASLDISPLWAVFLISFAAILIAAEAGYRVGRIRHNHTRREKDPTVGSMVTASLGLLAFLLAFTFGLAASRFEARRQSLLDETNTIGVVFLRTDMLPETQRKDAQRLLREYVDVRLGAVEEGKLEHGIRRSTEIQSQLWNGAMAAAKADSRSNTNLYIQSLNDLISVHTKRLWAATGSRIPDIVWLVLFAVAILSFGSMGYSSGLTGAGRSPIVVPLALAFAVVMWLVVDLDRPQEGLLKVSQAPMVELRAIMGTSKP
jgi:hypothetical protein